MFDWVAVENVHKHSKMFEETALLIEAQLDSGGKV
jgi:hypothetical protein